MDRDWLEEQLAAGRSIESIAREVDRDPSTVSYWVKKHGLSSTHAERHAARGGLARDLLAELVEHGLTTRQIAAEVDRSQATVRHWLREYGLKTLRKRTPTAVDALEVERWCATHGTTTFVRYGPDDHFRCLHCRHRPRSEGVRARIARDSAVAGALPCRGAQVRPVVRQLPRRSRGGSCSATLGDRQRRTGT